MTIKTNMPDLKISEKKETLIGQAANLYGTDPELVVPLSKRLRTSMLLYLSAVHIIAIIGIVSVLVNPRGYCWQTYVFALLLWPISGLGITAGSHRLWAHRSYKAGPCLRFFLMMFNSIANQGPILWWSVNHRVHHLHTETLADPHDSNRGFFFSHVGWLLLKKHRNVRDAAKKLNIQDLKNDVFVAFQYKFDPLWNFFWCFAFPPLVAHFCWGESFINGFLLSGVVRYVFVLHFTWSVNSVVHRWGTKAYDMNSVTTDNPWVAFFSLGEGWHNWHHAFDWDYATAELGASEQFNPTKMFIDAMSKLGLAWGRRRAIPIGWQHKKERMIHKADNDFGSNHHVEENLGGWPLFRYRRVKLVKKDE